MKKSYPVLMSLLFVLLATCGLAAAQDTIHREVGPAEADSLIKACPDPGSLVLIDLRVPEKFATGTIAGAVNIQPDSLKTLDPEKAYLVFCGGDTRGVEAYQELTKQGFPVVYRIIGGIGAWTGAGLPLTGTKPVPF